MMNAYTVRVGWADTDSYQIVHHPVYLIWIEEAILEEISIHPREYVLESPPALLRIISFRAKFIHPAFLGSHVTIRVKPLDRKPIGKEKNSFFRFSVQIDDLSNKQLVLTANVTVDISDGLIPPGV